MCTPSQPLPEMTLRAPALVPPMVLFVEPYSIATPSDPLGTAAVPAAFVPMRLPSTVSPLAERNQTPLAWLPEITFPEPAAVPPTMSPVEPYWIVTPLRPLPSAAVPPALVPR